MINNLECMRLTEQLYVQKIDIYNVLGNGMELNDVIFSAKFFSPMLVRRVLQNCAEIVQLYATC